MITVIDNYDSFTWNLVQLIETLTSEPVEVMRNDAFEVEALLESRPRAIVISPGPGTPARAGRCIDLIRKNQRLPLLGVCLGHQAIGEAFGGRVMRGPTPVHGKGSSIRHDGEGLFTDCPNPMSAARYHSLIIQRESLPSDLRIDAEADGLIMAVTHRRRPTYGIQFHPESYGTTAGAVVMRNFLRLAEIS